MLDEQEPANGFKYFKFELEYDDNNGKITPDLLQEVITKLIFEGEANLTDAEAEVLNYCTDIKS